MAEREPPPPGESKVAGTLLGVPAPRVESTADSPLRSPVFVRSGTSVADVEGPPPLPRMALPSRPLLVEPLLGVPGGARSGVPAGFLAWAIALGKQPARVAGVELALGMVAVPALGLWLVSMLWLLAAGTPGSASVPLPLPSASGATLADLSPPGPASSGPLVAKPSSPHPAELAAKSPELLSGVR